MTKEYADTLVENPLALGHFLGYTKLTKLHLKWILDAWTKSTSEGIQAARGTYKSTAVIIVGAIWYMLLYPQASIFIIRKTYTNATSFIKEIRAKLNRAEVQELFSTYQGIPFKLAEESNSRILLANKKNIANANVEGYGVTDAKTGAHADVILCDDIITLDDRIYAASRQQTNEALNELINIAKENCKFIFTGTVWHEKDSWGWIENHIKTHGGQLKKYPASNIWTQLFSAESLEERKKTINPYLYAVNYERSFISDTSLLFQTFNS